MNKNIIDENKKGVGRIRRVDYFIIFLIFAILMVVFYFVLSAYDKRKIETIEMHKIHWSEFAAVNKCKLVGKMDMGGYVQVEYSYLCADGVTYTNQIAP